MQRYLALFLSLFSFSKIFCSEIEEPTPPKKTIQHYVSSSFFYRHHDEGSYKYETTGLGLHYGLTHRNLMDYKLSSFLSFNSDNFFTESEGQVRLLQHVTNYFHVYPAISGKFILHHYNNVDEWAVWASKAIVYLGVGLGADWSRFAFSLQGDAFRDILNRATLKNEQKDYSGKFYSNPSGIRLKGGLKFNLFKSDWIGIEAFYARAFDKSYEDTGGQVHMDWVF